MKAPDPKYIVGSLLVTTFIIVRLYGLGTDILNSDGARWYRRSEKFMVAVGKKDWKSTYQHYQPGVTLMWINAFTRKAIWIIQDAQNFPRWSLENSTDFLKIHAVSKGVLVLVFAGLFTLQLIVLEKIASPKVSIIYGTFVATEPYIIGLDRWFHLTSLESYLGFTAFLIYLYNLRTRRILHIATVGFLLALAVLSKLTALVVIVFIMFIEFSWGFYSKKFRTAFVNIVVLTLTFTTTVFLLFPAMWVDGPVIVSILFKEILSAVKYDGRAGYYSSPFYYVFILFLKTSLVTILVFCSSVFTLARKPVRKTDVVGYLVLAYFLTLFLALTLSEKKIDRYALILFPPLILFGTLYLIRLKEHIASAVICVQISFFVYALYINYPVVSGYYSPLFLNQTLAIKLGVYENSGEYLAQAALFLNKRNRGVVCVPDNTESFKYLYKGETVSDCSDDQDYYVTTLDFDRSVPKYYYPCPHLLKSFGPKFSDPVVFVYSCGKN